MQKFNIYASDRRKILWKNQIEGSGTMYMKETVKLKYALVLVRGCLCTLSKFEVIDRIMIYSTDI